MSIRFTPVSSISHALRNASLSGRDKRRYVHHIPQPIRHASGHCRSHAQALVNAVEVIVHAAQGYGKGVVFDIFLRKRLYSGVGLSPNDATAATAAIAFAFVV